MSRILIYAMNYAPELVGAGRFTADLGAHLAATGHEVIVVTTPPHYPEWRAPPGANRWARERIAGVTVLRCPLRLAGEMTGLNRLLAPLSFALSSAPVALWAILRRRPDVVLCVEPTLFVAPLAWLGARLAGARLALHVQDLEIDAAFALGPLARLAALKPLAFAFEGWCLRRFDRVATISARMAARLADKGVARARLSLVRNWVDLDLIRPLAGESPYRRELGLLDGQKVALYAGSLNAKAGFEVALEAMRRLAGRPDIVFVVAGDGPARARIAAQAASLANLRLLPLQPESRMADLLGLADLHLLLQRGDAADLVLPSKLGGLLASGRPILATAERDSELGAFLAGAATLTPPDDAAALARAIPQALALGRGDAQAAARRRALASSLSKSRALAAFADLLAEAGTAAPTPARPARAPRWEWRR